MNKDSETVIRIDFRKEAKARKENEKETLFSADKVYKGELDVLLVETGNMLEFICHMTKCETEEDYQRCFEMLKEHVSEKIYPEIEKLEKERLGI